MGDTFYNLWIVLYILSNTIIPAMGYEQRGQSETCSASKGSSGSKSDLMAPMIGTSSNTSTNIVLFDGVCNFCNKWVDIMLQLDTEKKFRFCAIQSPKGRDLVKQIGRNPDELTSVILIKSIENCDVHLKSDAVLKVTEQLGFFWFLFSNINSLLPLFIRNAVYDMVARNRYSISGKRNKCRCADDNYSDRFI